MSPNYLIHSVSISPWHKIKMHIEKVKFASQIADSIPNMLRNEIENEETYERQHLSCSSILSKILIE